MSLEKHVRHSISESKSSTDFGFRLDKENTADAHELAEEMKTKHGIDITLLYAQNGFVFVAKQADLEPNKNLPRAFINVVSASSYRNSAQVP